MSPAYAELCSWSNASFLRGASHPEEMVQAAHALGYSALAITDKHEIGGVVRAHIAAKQCGMKLLIGAEIDTVEAELPSVVLIARNRLGYARLCRLLTECKRSRPRGEPGVPFQRIVDNAKDCVGILLGSCPEAQARAFLQAFHEYGALAMSRLFHPGEEGRNRSLEALSEATHLPLIATGRARCHEPERTMLLDVLTAIREGRTVADCGYRLEPNEESALQLPQRIADRFQRMGRSDALERTLHLADACSFSLDELRFVYPRRHLPPGESPASYFRGLVMAEATQRYGAALKDEVRHQLNHELALILRLGVEGFFLTMYDIIRFARGRGILCQGRGSAANSALCYALGITAVEPVSSGLLFERFLSEERNEPPDIDVDFEHERREEVIQFVYERYGRDHAGLVCENIRYRPRSAIRDVGKALGLRGDAIDRLAKRVDRREWNETIEADSLRECGVDLDSTLAQQLQLLVPQLLDFPRHRGTHVGGMIVTDSPLIDTIPLEDAAMEGRSILPWDKNDCKALGICKFDLLGLGILTAIRKTFALVKQHTDQNLSLHTIPSDDPETYARVQAADTVGVFQLESRAQMSSLPRLKPTRFYDIAIAISLIRPGPIQGGMVHPYLRRRAGEETVTYPHPALEPILARTLGVPLFQEQVMRIAVSAAGFTPGEADELRRAMGAWRRRGRMSCVRQRLIDGMRAQGISVSFAEQIVKQIEGFGEYGFPESHAISFALLAYASAFLKTHYPAAFVAALLNSQPMGFYAPHTLIEDVQRHGVSIRPIDVVHSHWDCTLEDGDIRLGVRLVRHLGPTACARFEAARRGHSFDSIQAFSERTRFDRRALAALARAGAFRSLHNMDLSQGPLTRRQAFWEVLRPSLCPDNLALPLNDDPPVAMPALTLQEEVRADYVTTGTSPLAHPVVFLRPELTQQGVSPVVDLSLKANACWVWVGGLVIARQHPQTAKGFVFLSLEDETGILNVVIHPRLFARKRSVVTQSPFLVVGGELQSRQGATSLRAVTLRTLDESLSIPSRDFR